MTKASKAAYKAAATRKHRAAANKAWRTMWKREARMTDAEREVLHASRVAAAKKAWRTIRAKAA
jgi:hypothetical protein